MGCYPSEVSERQSYATLWPSAAPKFRKGNGVGSVTWAARVCAPGKSPSVAAAKVDSELSAYGRFDRLRPYTIAAIAFVGDDLNRGRGALLIGLQTTPCPENSTLPMG